MTYSQDDDCHLVDTCEEIDWVVEFDFQDNLDAPVGSEICIPLLVNNFNEVISFQFTITFDPSILQFTQKLDPQNLPTFDPASSCNLGGLADGNIGIIYFNQNLNGVCLPDGTEIVSFCFNVIGEPGECSSMTITDNVVSIEVAASIVDESLATAITCPLEFISNDSEYCVGCNTLTINGSHCSTDTGVQDGAIIFSFCGGTGPYDWTMNAESGTVDEGEIDRVDNLDTGMYTVNVTDAAGATESLTIQILNQPAMVVDLIGTNPTCVGREDGEVTIDQISGGFQPYFESWSNFEFNSSTIDDLNPGEYSVTVTDGLGCRVVATQTLLIDTLKTSANLLSGTSCPGGTDGSIELSAIGGTPGGTGGDEYKFITPNGTFSGPTPFINSNATDGWFYFQVEDYAIPNCTSPIDSIFVPTSANISMVIESTPASCFGECDGFIRVTPDGGSLKYQFALFDENSSLVFGGINIANEIYENPDLCAGEYTIYVTDINFNCQIFDVIIIGEPDLLVMSQVTEAPTCTGNDGKISLGAMGGTPGYEYLWDDGDMNSMKDNLGGGMYCATITDMNGCKDSLCVTLVDGGDLNINPGILQTISCPNSTDGKITVDVLTGGNNFAFQWYDSNMNPFSNLQTICDVGAGIYFIQVEDLDQNCTSDMLSVVLAPGLALAVTENLTSPSCPGLSDGIVAMTVTGGSGNPTFAWDNSTETGSTLFSIPAGQYCVTISDGPCAIDTCVNLLDPPSILIDIKSIDPVVCFGESTGAITLQATGGTLAATNFFYTIFDLDNNTIGTGDGDCITISNLPAGDLLAFASDGQCPSEFIPFTITQSDRIGIDPISEILDPTCAGICNGSAMIQALGGAGPYTFFWPDYGVAGANVNNLCSGKQYLEITDNQGCMVLDSFNLIEPDTLIASIDPFQTSGLSCNDGENGRITIMHMGGNVGTFTYEWTDNVSDNTRAENLGAGLYEITVTDSQGCTDSVSYELVVPDPIQASISSPPMPDCFGGQTCITIDDVTGGVVGNYTFSINQGIRYPIDTCINVFAGQYTVNVFDAAGCSVDTMFLIDQPFELEVDLGDDFVEIDLGDSTATLDAIISSFLPISDISWLPLENFECVDIDCQSIFAYPTQTTEYTVVVTDENGCTASDNVIVRLDEDRNVYFPNIFSPNNDGSNDIFQIYAGDGVEMIDFFRIYDRWGNKLFSAEDLEPERAGSTGWDGTFKGKPLTPGVYVYIAQVTYIDGRIIKYSRDFTLFR